MILFFYDLSIVELRKLLLKKFDFLKLLLLIILDYIDDILLKSSEFVIIGYLDLSLSVMVVFYFLSIIELLENVGC